MCTCGAVFAQASWRNHRTDLRKLVADGKVAPDHPCITSSKAHPLPLQDAAFFAAYSESRWADARELACVPTLGCKFSERDLCWDTSIAGLKAAVEAGYTLPFTGLTNGADWNCHPRSSSARGGCPLAAPHAASSQDSGSGSGSADLGAGPLRSPASRREPPPRRPPPTSDPTLSPEVDDLLASGRPTHRARTARPEQSACVSIDSDDGEGGGGCDRAARQPVTVPVASIRARLEPMPAALAQASRVRDFPPDSAALGPAWFYGVAAAMADAAINNSITPTADVYAEYSLISAHFRLFPDFVAHFAADSVARELSLTTIQQLPDDDTEAWALLFDPAPGPFQDGTLALHYAAHGPCTMPTGLLAAATAFLDRCYEQVYAAAAVAASSSPSPTPEPARMAPVRTPRPPALASVRPPAPPPPSPTPSPEAPKPDAPDSGSSDSGSCSEGSTPQLP